MPLAGAAPHPPERKPQSEDLFSAHNFDITINLDIPAPGTGDTLFFMTIYSGYNNCYKSALKYRHFWKYPESSLSDTLDKYTLKDMC